MIAPSLQPVCCGVQCIVSIHADEKCLINVALFNLCFHLNGARLKELPVKFTRFFKIKNYSSY